MKDNLYTPDELETVYRNVREKETHLKHLSGHYNAKVFKNDATMNGLQETIRTMVNQYYEIESVIRDFEIILSVLGDEERERFTFVDIDRMKEEQQVRLESIRIIVDVPLPGMEEVTWIKQKGVE